MAQGKAIKPVRAWAHLVMGDVILHAHHDRETAKEERARWGASMRGQIIRVEIRPVPLRRAARKQKRKAKRLT